MNILTMNSERWHNETLKYVGRSKHALGLGNPWCHTFAKQSEASKRHVRFFVDSKGTALYRYREWLLKKLIPNYISGLKFIGLDAWEKEYLERVISLSEGIQKGEIQSLGCWCININNYLVVPEGAEKCHAEILYKACLILIAHRENALL